MRRRQMLLSAVSGTIGAIPLEHALWIDHNRLPDRWDPEVRIYFGHETCPFRLPTPRQAGEAAGVFREHGLQVSLVTPPALANEGLKIALAVIEAMRRNLDELEVVCNDWGVMEYTARNGLGTPVIGRLLAAQAADPRIVRMLCPIVEGQPSLFVTHSDGTRCRLLRRAPSREMAAHFRSCWLDRPEILSYLSKYGIRRVELSNVAQGIELSRCADWSYTLHMPEVLVSVFRQCPGKGEDFNRLRRCGEQTCSGDEIPWHLDGLPADLFRRDNALYYRCYERPGNLATLPVDRIVGRA